MAFAVLPKTVDKVIMGAWFSQDSGIQIRALSLACLLVNTLSNGHSNGRAGVRGPHAQG